MGIMRRGQAFCLETEIEMMDDPVDSLRFISSARADRMITYDLISNRPTPKSMEFEEMTVFAEAKNGRWIKRPLQRFVRRQLTSNHLLDSKRGFGCCGPQ